MGLLYIWMTCWCCFLFAEMKRVAAFDPMFLVSYTLPLFFMMYPFHQLVESSTVVVVSLAFSSIWFFRHVSKPNGQPLLKLGAVLLIESIYTLLVAGEKEVVLWSLTTGSDEWVWIVLFTAGYFLFDLNIDIASLDLNCLWVIYQFFSNELYLEIYICYFHLAL